jgi:DNA-binding MarR family transcriptional regulator
MGAGSPRKPRSSELSPDYRRYLSALVLFQLAAAESAGLSGSALQANNLLELDGPMTSGELASRLGLSTGATTRLVDRLVDAGYARRVPDSADRRRVFVEHTGHMPAELTKLLDRVRRPIAGAIATMNESEIDALSRYFREAEQIYRHAARELRAKDD